MFTRPENWNKMSPLERRESRLDSWQNSPVSFASPQAQADYLERISRLRAIYDLAPHDRPIADPSMGAGEYSARRKGISGIDLLYDRGNLRDSILEFHREFQPDVFSGAHSYPGKAWDLLDFKLYSWAGQKLPENQVIQAVEGEYMLGDEYREFSADPTGFWLKKYLPRAYGALAPLSQLPDFPRISESVDTTSLLLPFADKSFQEMLHKLMAAGDEAQKALFSAIETAETAAAEGFPDMGFVMVKTPFDYLGDTLRGTKGILTDMYRRPNDLLAACEAYVPVLIRSVIESCDQANAPCTIYVLHKGADTFMSKAQFEKFYWPTWKQVMLGLFEEGITSYLFIEGSYNLRLEYLAEMPAKSLVCHFDRTEMQPVKEVLSDKFIIAGNVPASLMATGTADEVRACCNSLVDLFGDAPGYILAHGCSFENTTDEKIRIFIDSVK